MNNNYPTTKSMNLQYGCEIMIDTNGRKWFRGAGTDWCYFPAEHFSEQELKAAKIQDVSGGGRHG